jgi:hypothetical protein
MRTSRGYRLFDATSQWFNVLIFDGDPNFSMSGDAHRFNRSRFKAFVDFIFRKMEQDHCKLAHEADIQRARDLLKEIENSS